MTPQAVNTATFSEWDQSQTGPEPFVREGLGIEVDFSLPAERVIRSLDQIIEWRGKPSAIRVDNGPQYVSGKFRRAEKQGVALNYIQPGKPQQNAYVERYNRTVRHEWLDQTTNGQYGYRRHHARTEIGNGRVNSNAEPR